MANFVERISVIVESTVDGARSGFSKLSADVKAAEGTVGKFKAGWSNAMASLKANAAPLAAAAGAALLTFAVSSADKFKTAALEARNLAQTLGTTSENASRLLAVFKPLGIELGDAQDVMNNLSALVDRNDASLTALGVTVARGQDGRVDMNETFIRIVEALQKIEDPAKRAALAAQMFGEEGARQFGPLVAQADQLRESLAAVGDEQIIDAEEVKKAEKMAAAQKAVGKAFDSVVMVVGELAAELGPTIERLAESAEGILAVADALGVLDAVAAAANPLPDYGSTIIGFDEIRQMALDSGDAVQFLTDKGYSLEFALKFMANSSAVEGLGELGEVATSADIKLTELGNAADFAAGRLVVADDKMKGMTDSAQAATERVDELDEALERIANDNAALDMADQFDDLADAALRAYSETAEGTAEAEQAQRDYQREINNTKARIIEYADRVLKLPNEKITEITAMVDAGDIAGAEAELDRLARTRDMFINVKFAGGNPSGDGRTIGNLSATEALTATSSKPGTERVGVAGAGVSIGPIYVTATPGTNGQQVGADICAEIQRQFNDGTRYPWMAA